MKYRRTDCQAGERSGASAETSTHQRSDPLRVLAVVEPRSVPGGGVRAALSLGAELQARKMVACFSVYGVNPGPQRFHSQRVRVIPSPGASSMRLSYLTGLSKAIAETRPHIVHALGLYTGLASAMLRLARHGTFGLVVAVHRATTAVRGRALARVPAALLSRTANAGVFLTPFQKRLYATLRFHPRRSYVIPNVVPNPEIGTSKVLEERRRLMSELDASLLLVSVGRLVQSKRVDVFIGAVADLRQRGIRAGGVVVGDGEERGRLEALAIGRGVKEHLRFVGFTDQSATFVELADAILMPSEREALPNTMIEAFAMAKLVIVSELPELEGIAIGGVNVIQVQERTTQAFADACFTSLERETVAKIKASARRTYEAEYQPCRVAGAYMEVYRRVRGETNRNPDHTGD